MTPQDDVERELDPRRWITLGVLVATVILVAMDTSVLNVSIPSMLRDLDTTVPSLEWVIAGYSLTFASLLIIGGRLGDIFGHRRLFLIGVTLFGVGSFIAATSPNVGILILGEAVIEGIGAAMMVPATLALLATHVPRQGAGHRLRRVGCGRRCRGGLRSRDRRLPDHQLHVALVVRHQRDRRPDRHHRLAGADEAERARGPAPPSTSPARALIAAGIFGIVFALSQSPTYGWFAPKEALTVGSIELWPASVPVSVTVVAFVLGVAFIGLFVRVEKRKERGAATPSSRSACCGSAPSGTDC